MEQRHTKYQRFVAACKGTNRGLPPLVHQRDQASLEEAVEAARRGLMTSRVAAWVIPTNEEVMIARHTLAIAAEGRAGAT